MGLKNSSMISRWEKGLALPSMLNAFKLALLYRIWTDNLYMDLLDALKGEIQMREDVLVKQHHA